MLYEPEQLTARAGQGVRQGFANAGPLELQDADSAPRWTGRRPPPASRRRNRARVADEGRPSD